MHVNPLYFETLQVRSFDYDYNRTPKTLVYLASETQLRVLAVEAAARLSLLGGWTIRNEISMYRAYHARKLMPPSTTASQIQTLKLSTPQKSNVLFKGVTGTSNSTTSAGKFPRWTALIGLTAAQLAVAYRWPLESEEGDEADDNEADTGNEERVGQVVKRIERLEDFLASTTPVLRLPDLAMEFWEDFAEGLQP